MLLTAIFVLLKACTEASSALNGSNDLSFQVISPTIIKWLQTRKNKRFLPVVVKTTKKKHFYRFKTPIAEKKNRKKPLLRAKKSAKNRGRFLDWCGLPCLHHSDHGLGRLLQAHKMTDSGFDRGTKGCLQESLATYAQIFKFLFRKVCQFSFNFVPGRNF